MYVEDILCGISKETFEIPHKISYPYIYSVLKIEEVSNVFETAPWWLTSSGYQQAFYCLHDSCIISVAVILSLYIS